VTYPNMMELFETLGVDMDVSDMSFSVSLDDGHGYEWGTRNGTWKTTKTLAIMKHCKASSSPHGYSELFQKAYLVRKFKILSFNDLK
ncbi:hypothetical protein R6Q59_012061, partial [Mikania micrantha]